MSSIVCKEVFDDNYQPSVEEIYEYATKIGIDPESEPHLLHLAKEGLLQALPKDWKICYNEQLHAHYYYNEKTKITQWEHPLDDVYRKLAEHLRQNSKSSTLNSIISDEGSQVDSGIKSQGNDETDTNMERITRNIKRITIRDLTTDDTISHQNFHYDNLRKKSKNSFNSQWQTDIKPEVMNNKNEELRVTGTGARFIKAISKRNENDENNKWEEENNIFHQVEQNFKGILRDGNLLELKRSDDEVNVSDEKKSVRFNLNDIKIAKLSQTNQFLTKLDSFDSENEGYNFEKSNFSDMVIGEDKGASSLLDSEKNLSHIMNNKVPNLNAIINDNLVEETITRPLYDYSNITDSVENIYKTNILMLQENLIARKSHKIAEENLTEEPKLKEVFNKSPKTNIAHVQKLINTTENEDLITDQLSNVSKNNWQMVENRNSSKEFDIMKLSQDKKLREIQNHFDTQLMETKISFGRRNNDAIEKLKERLAEEMTKSSDEILTNHKIAINVLQKNHTEILEELERDLKSEEILIRKEHSNKLKEMKENLNEELKIEKQKMKESGEDRLYEKIRCEKRLLEDKYRCLKEKYMRLKTDVRLSLEKRNRRREQVAKNHQNETTISGADRSVSNKISSNRNNSEMKSVSLSSSYPDHYQLEKSSNVIKSYTQKKTDIGAKKSNISSKYIKQLQVKYNDDTASLSHSDTTISNKDCKLKFLQEPLTSSLVQEEFSLSQQFTSDQIENNNNNNNQKDSLKKNHNKMQSASNLLFNDVTKSDRSYTPVENLRQQLQTIDDLEDLFPDNALDSYHLRYPFADTTKYPDTNSTELEFFKHRIHLERETLRRAKESLRSQRTNFRIRERDIKQKYKLLNSNITLEQLTQEEKELAEIEVNLHRTKSLLGEKVIRLRHLEKSIRIIYVKQKPMKFLFDAHKEDATLSDLSSHSSSGFSSNELGTETNAFLNQQKVLFSRPSDAVQNLEILNAEIFEILDILKKKNINEHYNAPEVNWLENSAKIMSSSDTNSATSIINMNSAFGERFENYQNYRLPSSILTESPRAINYTSNLVERVRDLKNWLIQAEVDYDIVLANNLRLTLDGAGDSRA